MKDNINKLCKLIIKESEIKSDIFAFEKIQKLKCKILNNLNDYCKKNKLISPVINRDIDILCFFENIQDLIQYKNEINSFIVNNMKIILTNTEFKYIIESDQVLRINVIYNNTNCDIIKNITSGFHKHEVENEFLSIVDTHYDKPKDIEPFHINIKNIEQAKIYLKNIEK